MVPAYDSVWQIQNNETGIDAYRVMLERTNQAMLAGDEVAAMAIRKRANRFTVKMLRLPADAGRCRPTRTVPMWPS